MQELRDESKAGAHFVWAQCGDLQVRLRTDAARTSGDGKGAGVVGRPRTKLYAGHLIRHLAMEDKQITSASSGFLDACRAHASGKTTDEELQAIAVRLGFNNVVDAFQNLSGAMGQTPIFYEKDYANGRKELVLKDGLLGLAESNEEGGASLEIEARWRLVETAWSLTFPSIRLRCMRRRRGVGGKSPRCAGGTSPLCGMP